MPEQPTHVTLGSYNTALLMGPQQPKEPIGQWQDRQNMVMGAILDLGEPDFLTLVELADHQATAAQLRDIENQMGELNYAGVVTDGTRGDKLRVSAWVKKDLCVTMGKLALPGLGELPQVGTKDAVTTALHHDSISNKKRVIANQAIRYALNQQMAQMVENGDPKAQFLNGDFNSTYVDDTRQTRLYHVSNALTRHIPGLLPRFSFYSDNRVMRYVSDGIRVCDMPNNKTMDTLTGGGNAFINAAPSSQSAATLFKGPVSIRTDHILGRAPEGVHLAFGGYKVHDLLAGDHSSISTEAFITK